MKEVPPTTAVARRIDRLEAAVRRREAHRVRQLAEVATSEAPNSLREALAAHGVDVVAELAKIAADWRTPDALRARILTTLAQYGWPRLAAVEVASAQDHRFVVEAADWPAIEAEADGHAETLACLALCRAVIERALLDASDARKRPSVRDWLGGRDFARVCEAADVCPRRARARIAAALRAPARPLPRTPCRRVDHPRRAA